MPLDFEALEGLDIVKGTAQGFAVYERTTMTDDRELIAAFSTVADLIAWLQTTVTDWEISAQEGDDDD